MARMRDGTEIPRSKDLTKRDKVPAGGYVVVKASYDFTRGGVKSVRVDRITQTVPRLADGERCFYLNVLLPASIFLPMPTVFVEVPEGDVIVPEVTVG